MPPEMIRTLRYHEAVGVDVGAAGITVSDSLAMNDTYDPYVAAGGHQPAGHDQLFGLYERCQVLSCTARVEVVNNDGTYANTALVMWNTDNTIYANMGTNIENGCAKTKLLAIKGQPGHKWITWIRFPVLPRHWVLAKTT